MIGNLKRIHVNQHIIKKNRISGERNDPLTVKTYAGNYRAGRVAILDDDGKEIAAVVYSPDKPLDCGATVWIETRQDLELG